MGRKLGLERGDVVGAAAAIADAEGIEAVTLASVAGRLGVRSPSLYAHVNGVDDLRRELSLHAVAALGVELHAAGAGSSGLETLHAIAHAYRAFATAHPGWYRATQRAVAPGEDDELYDALAACAAPVVAAMGEAGVPAKERVHMTRAFRAGLHGFVTLEQGGGFGRPDSVDESFQRTVAVLIAGIRAAASDS